MIFEGLFKSDLCQIYSLKLVFSILSLFQKVKHDGLEKLSRSALVIILHGTSWGIAGDKLFSERYVDVGIVIVLVNTLTFDLW